MADNIRNEFYEYAYEHPDMLGCISDALARIAEGEDIEKQRHHIHFDLMEIHDDLHYKHRTILNLIKEVRKLRKQINGN